MRCLCSTHSSSAEQHQLLKTPQLQPHGWYRIITPYNAKQQTTKMAATNQCNSVPQTQLIRQQQVQYHTSCKNSTTARLPGLSFACFSALQRPLLLLLLLLQGTWT
jgi:hypothetical protein